MRLLWEALAIQLRDTGNMVKWKEKVRTGFKENDMPKWLCRLCNCTKRKEMRTSTIDERWMRIIKDRLGYRK